MLRLTVPMVEGFDEATSTFFTAEETTLELEHSLVSLSKWESRYEKPFLATEDKTPEQIIQYVKYMALDPETPEEVYEHLSEDNFKELDAYINSKQTATWFSEREGAHRAREIITAEIIYYWMTAYNIPFECQHWHLARLITLIRVCNQKSEPGKPMSRDEIIAKNRELNAQRRAQSGSRG